MIRAGFKKLSGNAALAVGLSFIEGWGVYACEVLPGGSVLLEYRGKRVLLGESGGVPEAINPRTLAYLEPGVGVDGDHPENEARWVNHSCEPNAQLQESEGRLWVIAGREIRAGEEVVLNYGYTVEEALQYPCRCGAARCPGYPVGEPWRGALLQFRARQARVRRMNQTAGEKSCRKRLG